MMPDSLFSIYHLDNGLRVALAPMPGMTVAAQVEMRFGAVHEKQGQEGLAHFMEHCLMSAGSARFSPDAAEKVRGRFRDCNAFTSYANTTFTGSMLPDQLPDWLTVTGDHLFSPLFDEDHVRSEKGIVLRELADSWSDPSREHVMEFQRNFYGNHPKGIFVLGKGQVIKDVSCEELRSVHDQVYVPNNMDLIIAGSLPVKIKHLIETHFGGHSAGVALSRDFGHLSPPMSAIRMDRHAPDLVYKQQVNESSAHFFMAFPGPDFADTDVYDCRVLMYILGMSSYSRLVQRLRLKLELTYQSGAGMKTDRPARRR